MDFEKFNRGVYQLMVSIGAIGASFFNFGTSSAVHANELLKEPTFISSSNIIQKTTIPEDILITDNFIPLTEEQEKVEIVELKKDLQFKPSPKATILVATIIPTPKPTPTPTPLLVVTPLPKVSVAPQVLAVEKNDKPASESANLKTADLKIPTPEVSWSVPSPSPIAVKKSLSSELIFQLINAHRGKKNLPPFAKDEKLCQLAEYRGPQLFDEIFKNKGIHQGLKDLNLPYWITENMAHYDNEQTIFNWWLGSRVHRAAIEGNSKYSCGVCVGNSCAQLFTSYIHKQS